MDPICKHVNKWTVWVYVLIVLSVDKVVMFCLAMGHHG